MTRNEEIKEFLNGIYVPRLCREDVDLLKWLIDNLAEFREIEKSDSGTSHRGCLVIETRGRGKRETFKCYYRCRVDIGGVGEKMADIAIYYKGDSYMATPKRISRKNIKVSIRKE